MEHQVQFTVVMQRTSPDVPWFQQSAEHLEYINSAYTQPGLMVIRDVHLSLDSLIRTVVMNFSSIDARNQYQNDPRVLRQKDERDAHNEAHNIKLTQVYQVYNENGVVKTQSRVFTPSAWQEV